VVAERVYAASPRGAPTVVQIVGTTWGASSIPERWLKALELRDIIEQLAQDLVDSAGWSSEDAGDPRYTGW
jgi:hypothetical protein